MQRRKFLNIGGLGLLAFNGFSRNILPYFVSGSGQLCDCFLTLVGAEQDTRGAFVLPPSLICEKAEVFEKTGYKRKEKFYWKTGDFYLLPMELTDGFSVIDEVLLVFYKKNHWKYTGSLQASHLNWMIRNSMNTDAELFFQHKMADIFLPTDRVRTMEEGHVVFSTRKGKFGFVQYVHADSVSFHGFVTVAGKEECRSTIQQNSIYPEIQFHNTLSHI